jgi:[ribosomal protein S5]-alanine N-acetyltransferase
MFGFRHLRLHRIWGARSPANTAAQLAMLVAGMVEEGRIRHHVRARGVWRDSIVHSALEDEWEGHRET